MPSTIGFLADSVEELAEIDTNSELRSAAPVNDPEQAQAEGSRATRAATSLAKSLGIDLNDIAAPGIVRESDVREFAASMGAEASPLRNRIESRPAEAEMAGRVDPELLEQIRNGQEEFGRLGSDFKVWLYRKAGALIGENVRIGPGTVIDAEYIEIGDDTVLEDGIQVESRRFVIGELGLIGSNCKFICRDFVAGDVVTLRWNVAVVDGQGGIHDCRIGDLSFIAYESYLNTDRDLTLGERVCFAPGVRVYTHRKWLAATDGYPFAYAPVNIGDRCWLGPGSTVLPGVTLGKEVTLMANAVAANNAPAGALLGGSPAEVIVGTQKAKLSAEKQKDVLIEILGGAAATLERQGWTLSAEQSTEGIWAGSIQSDVGSASIFAVEAYVPELDPITSGHRAIFVTQSEAGAAEPHGEATVFDLETKRVQGRRDAASDAVRDLFDRYGVVFEPRLWRYGSRIHETSY